MVQPLWKTVRQLLKELSTELPNGPAFSLPGIYPKESKTYVHTKTCTLMFVVALLIIVKKYKQPKCPSTDEWIN